MIVINKEVWKDIYFTYKNIVYDYRGLYQVSNYGRVRSLTHKTSGQTKYGKIRIPLKGKYLKIVLYHKDSIKTFEVHTLVAEMFLDKNIYKCTDFDKNVNKNNLVVNHIDNNKHNNNMNNLEFCTVSYNNRYSKNKSGKRLKVYQYTKQGELLNTYESICEASRILNINARSLNRHCHLNDEYAGYIFMLKEVM